MKNRTIARRLFDASGQVDGPVIRRATTRNLHARPSSSSSGTTTEHAAKPFETWGWPDRDKPRDGRSYVQRMVQASLFAGFGRDRLIDEQTCDQYARLALLCNWVANSPLGRLSKAAETQLEASFVTDVLSGVLGYTLLSSQSATSWTKPPRGATGLSGTPDVVLGEFTAGTTPGFVVAVQLKGCGTDLDRPAGGRTPRCRRRPASGRVPGAATGRAAEPSRDPSSCLALAGRAMSGKPLGNQ